MERYDQRRVLRPAEPVCQAGTIDIDVIHGNCVHCYQQQVKDSQISAHSTIYIHWSPPVISEECQIDTKLKVFLNSNYPKAE